MDQSFAQAYKQGKDGFGSDNPALIDPRTGRRLTLDLASEEFSALSVRLKKLDQQGILQNPMQLMHQINAVEASPVVRRRLEEIAISLVQAEYGFSSAELVLDPRIENFHSMPRYEQLVTSKPSTPGSSGLIGKLLQIGKIFSKPDNQSSQPDVKELELEVHKRKIVNAIVHGGAHLGQNLFHLEMDKLKDLDPRMPGLYRQVMEVGDRAYWEIPLDEQHRMQESLPMGGYVQLDFSTNPIAVRARAASFPILLHELTKGVLEALALHGLPAEEKMRKAVLSASDKPEDEVFCLQVGPSIWKRMIKAIGTDAHGERQRILREFFKLPAKDFCASIANLCSTGTDSKLLEIKARFVKPVGA